MRTSGRRLLLVLLFGLIPGFILLVADTSVAQQKNKISWSAKAEHTKFTFQHALDIPDAAGHVLRMVEIRRTWPDGGAPSVEGLKVVEEIARGVSDYIAGNGQGWGYSFWRYENGDLSFGRWQNTTQTVVNSDGTKRTNFVGTYVTTGGNGKLKGLQGLGRYTGVVEFNAEGKATRNEYSGDGEYWFDK